MSGIKYSLRQESTSFSIGTTNLRSSNGSLIDTNGCVALLVLSGFAVATINFEKRILRKGDFVLLFYDSTFSMLSISAAFSVRYVSFAYHLIEEAIYKPLSINFGIRYIAIQCSGPMREISNCWLNGGIRWNG